MRSPRAEAPEGARPPSQRFYRYSPLIFSTNLSITTIYFCYFLLASRPSVVGVPRRPFLGTEHLGL